VRESQLALFQGRGDFIVRAVLLIGAGLFVFMGWHPAPDGDRGRTRIGSFPRSLWRRCGGKFAGIGGGLLVAAIWRRACRPELAARNSLSSTTWLTSTWDAAGR